MKTRGLLSVTLFCVTFSVRAQGTFQNLNFEAANVPMGALPTNVPFTNALPGWTGSRGPYEATQAQYNGISLGFAQISLIGRDSAFYSNSVIAGTYTAGISAGFAGTGFVATAISQIGTVPITARSLQFEAQGVVSDLVVTFNGQIISFVEITTGSNFQTYGGDISGFAGANGELRFTERPISGNNTTVLLDSIEFSVAEIPEPSVVCLSALGIFLIATKKKLKAKKS